MASLAPPPGRARFTSAEFLRMAASGAFGDIRIELIAGELDRMPPPGNRHSAMQMDVVLALAGVVARALLRVAIGIDLGGNTIVGGDAAILTAPYADDGMIPAAAIALAVEIAASTADRDLSLKRRPYAEAGIPTYWVVDADRSVVHVFDRPEDGDYKGLALVRFGEPLAVPGTDRTIVLA